LPDVALQVQQEIPERVLVLRPARPQKIGGEPGNACVDALHVLGQRVRGRREEVFFERHPCVREKSYFIGE
jgi:hypothetical protein